MKKKTVFVGMSGGVDSSVSAAILKEKGYNVVGVFIRTWHPDFLECNEEEERMDAMRVCAHLDIPFLTFDFQEVYKKEVADYMIAEYKAGRTPNPDVMCNKHVKFGAFLKKALSMGADYVATGHYAQNSKQVLSRSSHSNLHATGESNLAYVAESTVLLLVDINWISEIPESNKKYTCQVRYHGELLSCKVKITGKTKAEIILNKQVLVASGQSLVIYDKDVCLGGGIVV